VLETAMICRHPHREFWRWESEQDVELTRAALAAVDLSARETREEQTLSGGERRRLAIATLLAQDAQIYLHDIPVNPLHAQGYPSIGCMPCTSPVALGEDPRNGRWRGIAKTECGLHVREDGDARVIPAQRLAHPRLRSLMRERQLVARRGCLTDGKSRHESTRKGNELGGPFSRLNFTCFSAGQRSP
jgi:hypothetical protein